MAREADILALETEVARLHLQAQALNKQTGRETEATAVYKQLAALDDRALELRLAGASPPSADAVAVHANAGWAAYCTLQQPAPSWQEAAASSHIQAMSGQLVRQRALACMLGAVLADAAACPVQWVYSEADLAALAQGREGLEFFDPPQCPFFEYPLGAASPYGEQTRALLESLVAAGGLDCCRYAAHLYATFGPGFAGYRDRSTKSFLRRYAAGCLPPLTGSPDDQANCFTRLPPLVALLAGGGQRQLLGAVERMVRVTQNDDVAVAYGCAAALILEAVLLGASVTAAVARCMDWLQQQAAAAVPGPEAAEQAAGTREGSNPAPASPVPAALWGEVADRLAQAAELAPLPPLQAAVHLGRNCHLPNSLQTPLQVLMHLECVQQRRQPQQQQDSGGAAENEAVDSVHGSHADDEPAPQQEDTRRFPPAGEGEGFCLPCSMGSGVCALPSRPKRPSSAAVSSALPAGLRQQPEEQPATLPAGAFVQAVRMALRPGGCCASRAGFVGALAGALLPSGVDQLPDDWAAKTSGYISLRQLAEELVAFRD